MTLKNLRKQIVPFEKSSTKTSLWQIFNTIMPFFLLWYLSYRCLSVSYLLTLIISIINAGFLVRIFIIFHDCCHQSFLKSPRANKILGTITGVLTLFPYAQWAHEHSIHHAVSSNLDKRGTGDLWILTVDEYGSATIWRKIAYRLYRNPFIMFVLGPIYQFLLMNRFNRKDARKKERINTYLTNILIVLTVSFICWVIGWKAFLLIQGPIFLLSGSAGIWLFYVQHTFENSYFEESEKWDYVKAAIKGSSFYKLPKWLQWLTGNIGYHHVHHLCPRVPNYKLETVHDNTPALKAVPTITLVQSLKCLQLHLWDSKNKKFCGFKNSHSSLEKTLPSMIKAER